MEMNLLPLGSVVTLKDAKKKLMVMGVLVKNEETGSMFDYIGIPFPEGYLDAETMFLFMHKDIQDIHFLGFINAESQGFRSALIKELKEKNIISEKKPE